MKDRNCLKLFVFTFLLAIFSAGTVFAGGTVYVSTDSATGDYICDGVNDHIEINKALTHADTSATVDTVYLRGPATYVIDGSVVIGNNTTLTGDPTAVIKLVDSAGWDKGVPMIKVEGTSTAYKRNITICGFEIYGNDAGNGGSVPDGRGHSYYNMIGLRYVRNAYIHNMYMHNNNNDGMNLAYCDSVYYHDNRVLEHGHDGLYAWKSTHVWAYNDTISIRTNNGMRFYNTDYVKCHDNVITTAVGGSCAFEIEKDSPSYPMTDLEIYNNTIYSITGQGFWVFSVDHTYSPSQANVYIHHNKVYNCSGRGIRTCGFNVLLENNVFDGCSSGIGAASTYGADPTRTGLVIRLRNNIIMNSGTAVENTRPTKESIILENNCLFGNTTTYSGSSITHSNDIYTDPLFANRAGHDYHLKSWAGRWNGTSWVTDTMHSPCIDAGLDSSAFNLEPENNGDRINIGRYGNTVEASKSVPLSVGENTPTAFSLSQNTPNPFNPSTSITYSIPATSAVNMTIFNAAGQQVATLVNEKQAAGAYTVEWKPGNLASGVFFCRLEAGSFTKTMRLVFLK